jgi:DegV family protein with EDD domain
MERDHIAVFTDSTSDIDKKTTSELDINVIPLAITIGGESFFDGETITTSEIINKMHEGYIPKTASPGNGVIKERFDRVGDKQIVSVFISDDISAIVSHARMASKEMIQAPKIIDSRTTSMTLGFLAIDAAQMALDGKPATEIQEQIEDKKQRTVAIVGLPTLKYVVAGGRVSHIQGLMGGILHIKPILMMHEGKMEEVEKVRTWGKTKERLIEIIKSLKFEHIAVMFGENDTEANEFIDDIKAFCSNKILKMQMGSAILTHSGPQVLAVCGILKPGSPQLTPTLPAAI